MNGRSPIGRCGLLAAALLLAGCMSSPPIPASPPAAMATAGTAVVGTEIAGPDTILQPLPTGVLLLTEPADGEGFERNLATCRAFFTRLPSAATLRAEAAVAPNIIATRWLTARSTVPSTDCAVLVNQYDYARAAELIHRIHMEGRRGPFFAGFLGGSYVAVDGSSYGTGELGSFVGKWAEVIVRANSDYARLAASHDDMAMVAQPRDQLTVANVPGPALILIGILKTAVQAVFALASIFTG